MVSKNKIVIVALIIVIAALLIGIISALPNLAKHDVDLSFKGNSTLNKGDGLKIRLCDGNGTPLVNKTVKISITDKANATSYYSVVTNAKGMGKLKLNRDEGTYLALCSFEGDDDYNAGSANRTIKIKNEVKQAEVQSYSSNYDSGAFYSPQAGKTIYTGEVHEAPDGHRYKHQGNNKWVQVG